MDTDIDQLQPPSSESLRAGYETSTINVRVLAFFLVGLVTFAAVVHIGLWFLLEGYVRFDEKKDRPTSALNDEAFVAKYNLQENAAVKITTSPLPPAPRLQPTPGQAIQNYPGADLQQMYREEDSIFERMGWAVDKERHVQRVIPPSVIMQVIQDESARQKQQSTPAAATQPAKAAD
jgi:hypothetical protein